MRTKKQHDPDETEPEATGNMIIRHIPKDLKRDFKVKCAADSVSQQDKIIELMYEYVNGLRR